MNYQKAGSLLCKGLELTAEELEKINRLTRREFSAEELYCFRVVLCDNEVDRDLEQFDPATLEQLAGLFVGKTGIRDHQPSSQNQQARIYEAAVEQFPGKYNSLGEPYCALVARAYMVRTESNRDLILEIEAGIKKEVSVGCSVRESVCSICGANRTLCDCGHHKGETYDGRLCYTILRDAQDAYEWSFVAVPAQRQAGVIKGMQLEQQQGTVQKLWQAAESGQGVWLDKEQVCQLKRMMHNLLEDCEEARRGARRQITRLCASKGLWDEQASSGLSEVLDLLSSKQMKARGHLLDPEDTRDGMKDICLQGYNSRYITMQADGKMEPGDLVVMSGNNTVKKAAAGKFVGVAHAVRGDYVLVQTGGFAVLPYSGTAPTVGFATLAADSNADATASASGREVLVTEVDATA